MLLEIIYFTIVLVVALVCLVGAVLANIPKPSWPAVIGVCVSLGMVVWSGIYLAQGYGCNT